VDISEHKRVEEVLRKTHEDQEMRVQERTAQLVRTNEVMELEITESKRAEDALRETERFLTSIFSSIQDGLSILDNDMNIIRVNPAMEQWYSHALPLIGKKCYEAYQDRNQRCEICPTYQTINTGKGAHEVVPKRGVSGEILGWLDLFTFSLIDTTTGKMKGVIEFVRDITERKQAEEALHNEKQRFQTLSDQAPFGMMMIDKKGTLKYVNPKFKELFGYDLADVPNGKTWFRKAYPDPTYRHLVISDWLNDLEKAKSAEKRSRVFTATCKDGSEKIVNFISVRLETGENLVTCEDFTDQIRAEEALRKSDEESKTLAQENAIMAEIGRIISSTLKIEEVYERFAEEVRKLISFDRIAIRTINSKDKTVTIAYISGVDIENHHIGYSTPLPGSVAEECIRTQSGFLFQPESVDEVANRFPNVLPTFNTGLQSMIFVPLISKDQVIGVLSLHSTKPKAYTWGDLRLAEKVANQIAGAVANAQLFTQLKRTEEALRESERKFRDLYDNAPLGYHEYNLQGQITKVNQTDLEMLGYTAEEMIGQPIWKFNVGGKIVREQVLAKLAGTLPPGRNLERTYRKKDGATFPVLIQDRLILDEKGQIQGIRCTIQDITERKRAEEALRESEERYRTLAESAKDTIFVINREGRFQYMNHFGAIQFGVSARQIVGKPLTQLFPAEVAEKQVLAANSVFESGKPFFHEIEIWSDMWSDIRLIPILAQSGEVQSVMGIARDITERKMADKALRKSEEKFQKLFDEAPVGYMELDAKGYITQVNRTELAMLGYTASEMLGQPLWKFVVEEEAAHQAIKSKLCGSIPFEKAFERTYKRKDGTTLPVLIEDAPIGDAEERITGIHATIRDVSEHKRVEKEMANLQEQLRQSQKIEAIGRLAGGIAHDFNNLLTVIKGYSQLSLLDLKENNPLWENIQEIQKATQRATDLTRQLLAFSRRQILDPRVLDLNSLLRDTEKMLRRMIGEDIELVTRLSEDLGRVKIDPGQIEQVILNLAVNARDAMPSGGKLTIETANVESDEGYALTHLGVIPGHYVRLSVSDTGVGMSREVQEKAFDPFFTTKEKGKGTGLGLSTVHGIVTQSGGKIWVYSEPGHGTTFKIYFPSVEGKLDTQDGKNETESFPAGTETVLLVEDEPSVRDLANRLLKLQGYKVLEAANGEEALRLGQENTGENIHLLLTDVVLPQMGGKELADQLKIFRPGIKVLYTSGYTDYAIVHHGVLNSGTHFLQKPFSLKTLSQKVREALDK
jgi:two-component system cell cycle sensor histidine kinase/response regulator CckA